MQAQRRSHDNEVEVLRGELQSVKEENNRQQQLLAQNLQLPPEARIEASLQHEITRLTNENLVSTNTFLTVHIQNEFINVSPQQKALHNLKQFIFLISGEG